MSLGVLIPMVIVIGLLVGSYSSLFVAMPLVASLKRREVHWAELRRAAEVAGSHDSMDAATSALAAEQYNRSTPPRPRKMGRKR